MGIRDIDSYYPRRKLDEKIIGLVDDIHSFGLRFLGLQPFL